MKKVLVTGGTGNLGKWVVEYLLQQHYDVGILTTQTNIPLKKNIAILTGDLTTNVGIKEATADANVIIHCASNSRNFEKTDIEGTKNLLHSVNSNIMQKLVYISIVGVDKSNYPYYQAKYAVEKMIAGSGLPHTILRTTQFHNFVLNLLQSFVNSSLSNIIEIPAGMIFQSVDIREVAKRLVNSMEEDAGLLPDFGGPEVLSFEEMAQKYVTVKNTKAVVQPVAISGERYSLFRSGVNLCPENAYGKITWEQFLEEQFVATPATNGQE